MQIFRNSIIRRCGCKIKDFIGLILFAFVCCVVVASFLIWAYQIYHWLKEGVWIELPIQMFLEIPKTNWAGINKIIMFIWEMNVGLAILCIPIACNWMWEGLCDLFEEDKKEQSNTLMAELEEKEIKSNKKDI